MNFEEKKVSRRQQNHEKFPRVTIICCAFRAKTERKAIFKESFCMFAFRSSSLTGSFSSLASGEDVKARMMNKLKESTSKANISSLFNRKK